MSSGRYCVVRDLGLVKGGKGMRHHEVVVAFSVRELFKWLRQRSVNRFEPETKIAAGLLPRRFLFGAFDLEPERAAGEAGGVEIALGADTLEVQHGAQAVRRRL
jgi:hypothetical protein